MSPRARGAACFLLATLLSCNVTSLDEAGECLPLEGEVGERGLVVIDSDYQSTNVALVDWSGEGKSRSLVSSGGTRAGLSAALSGDVVTPSSAPSQTGQVVLLDRGSCVITWVDPVRCQVQGQLSVGTKTNPYDYLELSKSKAYVARNQASPSAAAGPLERGADVLVIDPSSREARASISLEGAVPSEPPGLGPFPAALLRWGGGQAERVLVLLQSFGKSDYDVEGPAVIVAIDPATDQVAWSLALSGVKNCGAALALPDDRVVVSCTGALSVRGASTEPGTSALVVLEPGEGGKLTESFRIPSNDLGGAPLLPYLALAGPDLVINGSYGDLDAQLGDRWFLVDLASRSLTQTLAEPSEPFVLGSIACRATGEGTVCMGADASRGAARLRRFHRDGRRLIEAPSLATSGSPASPATSGSPAPSASPASPAQLDPYGLPPRLLGFL